MKAKASPSRARRNAVAQAARQAAAERAAQIEAAYQMHKAQSSQQVANRAWHIENLPAYAPGVDAGNNYDVLEHFSVPVLTAMFHREKLSAMNCKSPGCQVST